MKDDKKIAWHEGYIAGIQYHLEGDERQKNPYLVEELYNAWREGFDRAGEDS
jgi:hypothetical protein